MNKWQNKCVPFFKCQSFNYGSAYMSLVMCMYNAYSETYNLNKQYIFKKINSL